MISLMVREKLSLLIVLKIVLKVRVLSRCLSAYEVKNNTCSCLFERLFKVKKNGVFFFGISSFVLEIFTFL